MVTDEAVPREMIDAKIEVVNMTLTENSIPVNPTTFYKVVVICDSK
jgi:hypothetical protein